MILAVIGSRTWNNRKILFEILDNILGIDEIVSGGAAGADSLAQAYAKERGKSILIIYPDYGTYNGKIAPLIRNEIIVKKCDLLIAFQTANSRGAEFTINLAKNAGKFLKVVKEQ